MQNQVALYLIFLTGIILLLAAILNSDYLLGSKKNIDDVPSGFLTRSSAGIIQWIMKPFLSLFKGHGDPERSGKRVFYAFLGIVIIILGIIALNSGKFS